jgi:tetratricopeptide (TPR) repeat protein
MANALCAQGKSLLSSGKNADARDIYASAVHRDGQNAHAWNGLGVAYDLLGKRSDAQDAYQHAVDLDPKDLSALNNLAHLDLEMGNPEDAVHLLQPHAEDQAAPKTLHQNLAAAEKAAKTKEEAGGDIYADLGSYPTKGMAQGHIAEARKILGSDADDLTFTVITEVKTGGGIPTFTVKVTGRSPQSLCEAFNAQALPCIPHEK